MSKHLHMIDSGAVSIFNEHNSQFNQFCIVNKDNRTGGRTIDYSFYSTKEFYKYVDSYIKFVKKWKAGIDTFVTVDALRNPEISWDIQQYIEKEHGVRPLPVIHFGSEEKWLHKYLDAGYDYIGLGGRTGRIDYFPWADRMWEVICGTKDRLPVCKVHGFAITTHKHMTRYPWYSVDSTTWKKMGYYSQIILPSRKLPDGNFSWKHPYMSIFVDSVSPYTKRKGEKGRHVKSERGLGHVSWVMKWLDLIDVPYGREKKNGVIIEVGVTNSAQERVAANIKYFLWLQSHIPEWPWPWERKEGTGRRSMVEAFNISRPTGGVPL